MIDYKLLSADNHITEHPDAFKRVQKEFPERAPRVVENPQGLAPGLWFFIEGLKPMHVGYFSMAHVVDKPDGRQNIEMYQNKASFKQSIKSFCEGYRYENHPEDWEPSAYLKAMDRDNIEAMILYASWARYNFAQDDAKFQRSILNSYNEWIFETFSAYAPKRFFPAPMISILDMDLAVKDMRYWVKRGAKTLHIPTTIIGSGYYEPIYEPLWQTAVELDVPLSVHANASQGKPHTLPGVGTREYDPRKYVIGRGNDGNGGPDTAYEFISNLIFSGVFDRHPSLKVGVAEFRVADAAHTYEMIDYIVGRSATYDPDRNLYRKNPSHYIKENVFFTFEESRSIVLASPFYGEDNYMWSSDFPHFQSIWPYSQRLVAKACEGLPPHIVRKLARDNTNRVYKLV